MSDNEKPTIPTDPPRSPKESAQTLPGERICPSCGNALRPTQRRHARFCTPRCRAAWHNHRRAAELRQWFEQGAEILRKSFGDRR